MPDNKTLKLTGDVKYGDLRFSVLAVRPNNRLQRTALRAAAEPGRYAPTRRVCCAETFGTLFCTDATFPEFRCRSSSQVGIFNL